jgi:putative transposase
MQNAYIERFNGSFRRDVLDAYLFQDLSQIRINVEEWMENYNYHRPQDSLNGFSPVKYARVNEMFTMDNSIKLPSININYSNGSN